MLGLENQKEKESVIGATCEMIMTLREENHVEISKITDYALRYKRRKDPAAFIDSVLFPTLEQAGSIVRFFMHYLGKDMLAAIGVWDLNEGPSLISPPQEKVCAEKKSKKKKKTVKKKDKNTADGKPQNQTTGTSETDEHASELETKTKTQLSSGLFDSRLEDEIEKMKWDNFVDNGEDNWIPVDEKKRKQTKEKPPKSTPTKEINKSSTFKSDAEIKKTLSSKKNKKKSISQARSVNSEGKSEEKKTPETDMKRDNLIENGKLLDLDGISDDHYHQDDVYIAKIKPKPSIESNLLELKPNNLGSQKSDSIPEIRSSVGSLETESIGISTDYKPSTNCDEGSQKDKTVKTPRTSKLRGPGQSKPFIHFDMQNDTNFGGAMKSPAPFGMFSPPQITTSKSGGLQSKLITTMSDADKKFFAYLNKSIGALLSEVEQHSARMKQIYTCLLERIKRVTQLVFPGQNKLDCLVYGSYATDLLVAYSDMDVCITGFNSMNRIQALEVLQTLSYKLELFGWCPDVKNISGATVPVIKIVRLIYSRQLTLLSRLITA